MAKKANEKKKSPAKKTGTTKAPAKKAASVSKTVKKAAPAKKASVKKAAPAKKTAAKKTAPKTAVVKDAGQILMETVVNGMQEKKAKHITVLDLRKIQNRVSDYFVICDAESNTHVNSIADSIEEEVRKKLNEKPFHSEGWENGQWILMDYVNVVAHVFQNEIREFYNLEGLWADAEIKEIA